LISEIYEKKFLPKICNCCCSLGPIQKQREKIVPLAEDIVLEIGIGSGLNIPFYDKNKVSKIIGLDPSEELNEMALSLAKENHLNIDFIISGAESIDLESNSVDTVLVTYTLCTIPEVIPSISEIKRVLKPEGKLLFCEHGISPNKYTRMLQNFLNPIWEINIRWLQSK
jgi:ubiquinone/menaquinone biosynthesis C-methylase UbiE